MYFRNLSDIFDFCNKSADINNCLIDNEKKKLKDEIGLLWENRHNPDVLRKYFLDNYSEKNFIARVFYAKQLRLSSAEKLYNMAEFQANLLFCKINNFDTCKIYNKPLKVIVQVLKAMGNDIMFFK